MNVSIEDFRTGWFGVGVGLTDEDIQTLITRLQDLRATRSHFHFRSGCSGTGGVADVEIYWSDSNDPSNMKIE